MANPAELLDTVEWIQKHDYSIRGTYESPYLLSGAGLFMFFGAGVVGCFEAAVVVVFDIVLIQGQVLGFHPAL